MASWGRWLAGAVLLASGVAVLAPQVRAAEVVRAEPDLVSAAPDVVRAAPDVVRAAPDVVRAAPDVVRAECSEQSWAGGTVEWCDGELVYRDYVYDDDGADTEPGSPHGTMLNGATGDVLHTDHGQSLNSADILVLRLRGAGTRIEVTALLNTLLPADKTVIAVAIDTDNSFATGGGPWGTVAGVRSRGHDVVHVLDGRDSATNTISGEIPMPPGPSWRIQAIAALGDGTPMNVAFRGHRETGSWWEATQSAALAAGDVTDFGYVVDRDLIGHAHRPAPPPHGFLERVYRSDVTVPATPDGTDAGEGVSYDGVDHGRGPVYSYLGRHQPYGVFVPPPRADRPLYGLQLVLHGLNAAHASLVNLPGMQQTLGTDLHRIIAVPLGRGPEGAYADYAERDVLDVMADIEQTYPVDRDQEYAGGYSMGGGGAYRLAALYPDRFAGQINWVGFSGDCLQGTGAASGRFRSSSGDPYFSNDPTDRPGCPSNANSNIIDYLDNLRWVPTAMLYAVADELVWANHAVALQQRWAELAYDHVLWVHAAEHLTFAFTDDWRKEAAFTADLTRVRRPSRVTFRTNRWMDAPKLGLVHDRAYWVSGVTPRARRANGADTLDAAVDLTSDACPSTEYRNAITRGSGLDPVPWVSQQSRRVPPAPPTPPANRIVGTLENVASLTIDVSGACLDPTRPVELRLASDGPSEVRFSDGRPAQLVAASAAPRSPA